MKRKSKSILGLSSDKNRIKTSKDFSEEERGVILEDYLTSNLSKRDIWEKYTGDREEHGNITRWLRMYGYQDKILVKNYTFATNPSVMKNSENSLSTSQSFENLQLKKRIEELEKQLKDSEMKSIAYSTMIDIAETEFKIKIRKKLNSKPLSK